jgi:hypothetical protein
MQEATYILTMLKLPIAQKIGHATRYAIILVKALLMRIFKSPSIGFPLICLTVLILALCILFPKNLRSMADVAVWGLLPKAQDDATTIDAEITAAVAAHNDDPTAHMAAGQSIDVHRVNSIIDHPQGSVLADKVTQTEWVMQDSFPTTDVWYPTNATKGANNYGLGFYATNAALASADVSAGIPFWNDLDFGTKEIVLQFGAYFYHPTSANYAVFGAGTDTTYISSAGLGIKFTNTGVQLYQEAKGVRYSGTAHAMTTQANHIYRVHLSPSLGNVRLFVDGVLVDTMTIHLGDDSNPVDAFEDKIFKNGGATLNAQLTIYNLYLSHQS